MENQGTHTNLTPSPEYLERREEEFAVWWEKFGIQFDLGLFFYVSQEDSVIFNHVLGGWLGLQAKNTLPEDAFWEMIASLADDQPQTNREIRKLREAPGDTSLVQFQSRMDPGMMFTVRLLSQANSGAFEDSYGGFVTKGEQSDSREKDIARVLDRLIVPARQLTAAVQGNLQALSGNFQSWSPEVLDQFLGDAREDVHRVNQFLDLVLSYVKVIKQISIVKQPVQIIGLLEDIIEERGYQFVITNETQSTGDEPLQVKIDRALVKIALETLFTEVVERTPPGLQSELRVSVREGYVVINLDSQRMLPLPGLVLNTIGEVQFELSPELYLAHEILAAQGGMLVVEGWEPEEGRGFSVEVSLPFVAQPRHRPIRQEWRDLLDRGSGRILLAEAQPEYQLRIRDALIDLGYRVDLAVDGSTVLDLIQTRNPLLVILARNLPGMDGLLVTQGVRRWSAVPIIMISTRDNMDDLLYAYRLGVDDYIQKPFLIEELLAKVQVFLGRQEAGQGSIGPEIFQEGAIRIDQRTRQVWVRGNPVNLTPIEYNLLVYLSRHIGQIIPYEQLLEHVWEGPEKGTRQGLFVHVRRLREKIEEDRKNPQIIGNKWGVGYVFNP